MFFKPQAFGEYAIRLRILISKSVVDLTLPGCVFTVYNRYG